MPGCFRFGLTKAEDQTMSRPPEDDATEPFLQRLYATLCRGGRADRTLHMLLGAGGGETEEELSGRHSSGDFRRLASFCRACFSAAFLQRLQT